MTIPWLKRTTFAWLLTALIAGLAPVGVHGEDPRPKERDTRDIRERERSKARENETLGRDGDKLGRGDEKISRDSDKISRDSDKLTKDNKSRDSERLAKSDDALGKDERIRTQEEARRQEAADRLQENNRVGKEWETKTDQYLKEQRLQDGKKIETSGREVTIQSADGTRSRADIIYQRPSDGKWVLVECKSSDTADFTKNQEKVYKRIQAGDEVTVRGNQLEGMRNQNIRIDEIYVSRPDAKGDVRLERYPSAEVRAEN